MSQDLSEVSVPSAKLPDDGRSARKSTVAHLATELVIVTAGVLIALLVQSLVESGQHRSLVREARATIAHEIADNKKKLDGTLAGIDERRRSLDSALKLADDLLATGKSGISSLNLILPLTELSAASWQSADRTGALSYMDYDEVQDYSGLYGAQDLFVSRERQSLEHLASAITIIGAAETPYGSSKKDLETFRQQVLALKADLVIIEQLGRKLAETYQHQLEKQK
jgi:hypothetical protein